jgi:hypothetical protein
MNFYNILLYFGLCVEQPLRMDDSKKFIKGKNQAACNTIIKLNFPSNKENINNTTFKR